MYLSTGIEPWGQMAWHAWHVYALSQAPYLGHWIRRVRAYAFTKIAQWMCCIVWNGSWKWPSWACWACLLRSTYVCMSRSS